MRDTEKFLASGLCRRAALAALILLSGFLLLPGAPFIRAEEPKAGSLPGVPLPVERFSQATPISMAAFLATDSGFAVAHLATAMGIPLFCTKDMAAAMRQPMLVIAGSPDAWPATRRAISQLRKYVASGGTLVFDDPEAGAAGDLAGLAESVRSHNHYTMTFDTTSGDPGLGKLTAPESRTISLGDAKAGTAIVTHGMRPSRASGIKVLASFEDGAPALVRRTIGKGRVYVLGATLMDLVLRPQLNRDFEAQRWYDNHFEPSADVPQIILRDWYLSYVHGAAVLDPVPEGLSGALIMTHDICWQGSVLNVLDYVKKEKELGVSSTVFMQTKYVKDYEDAAFYDDKARQVIAAVYTLGGDIGSHTVSHPYDWPILPEGTGKETAADYHPFVIHGKSPEGVERGESRGCTVAGDVRVSRELLKAAIPDAPIEAFRTGYLKTNPCQWRMLEENGYRFDSSYSSNDVLTAFPYTMMEDLDFQAESRILQFPVLLADSVSPIMPCVPAFKRVLDCEEAFHGVCVVLFHPDIVGEKLEAEEALIAHVRGRFWIGNLSEFGRFWENRSRVRLSASLAGNRETLTITSPEEINGLTLDFGVPVGLEKVEGGEAAVLSGGKSLEIRQLHPGRPVTLGLVLQAL